MAEEAMIQARYDDREHLQEALKSLRENDIQRYEIYGPVDLSKMESFMPSQGSPVHAISTVGAILGLISFYLMCVLSSLIYRIYTGGKPPISNVPFVIVSYEGTILLGSLATFFGVLYLAKLRPASPPKEYNFDYSGASFGVHVYCRPDQVSQVRELLTGAGAVEIHETD